MCAGATVFDREVACLRSNAELIGSVSIADGNSNYQTLTQPAQSNSREIENWAATGFRTHCGKNHSRMGLGLRATRKLSEGGHWIAPVVFGQRDVKLSRSRLRGGHHQSPPSPFLDHEDEELRGVPGL